MALKHFNNTVLTTATLIADIPPNKQNVEVTIYNGHSASLFLGDSTIATSGATIGSTLATVSRLQLTLNGGDKLYGIVASATAAGAVVVTYSI